jgi:hypothetical protein
MIYVNGLQGKKGYQKLHNVLDFEKNSYPNKQGYETLNKNIDIKLKTFNEDWRKKENRIIKNKSKNLLIKILKLYRK